MKPQKKFLNELTNKNDRYMVKVKVIDKSRPQISPSKTKYQKLVLQDEHGNRLQATLFNDDVEAYEDVIRTNMEYEITDAPVRPVNPNYALADEKYQIGFNNRTIVRQLFSEGQSSVAENLYNYQDISSIDRAASIFERFDLLGVVIFVEPTRTIPKGKDQINYVREIVITDNSAEQPMVISAWGDLALGPSDSLDKNIADFPIVDITALRPSKHKGFSLGTTISTYILTDPKGEKADILRKWAKDNVVLLSQRHKLVTQARTEPDEFVITTIEQIKAKKYPTTLQEEKYWVQGKIIDFDQKNVNFYLGCSNCYRRTEVDEGVVYDCRICHQKKSTSTRQMSYTFEITDGTANLTLTTFAKQAETMLNIGAEQLHSMKNDEFVTFCAGTEEMMVNKEFKVQIGPNNLVNTNKALKWVMKGISSQ